MTARTNSSSYITYDEYPGNRAITRNDILQPSPNMNLSGYKIPTYNPNPIQNMANREDKEHFVQFTTDDLKRLSSLNASQSSQQTPVQSPPQPPPTLSSSSPPTATGNAQQGQTDINPMSIPCLAIYSHIKDCPLCRQSIASMKSPQEMKKLEMFLIGLIVLNIIVVIFLSIGGFWGYRYFKTTDNNPGVYQNTSSSSQPSHGLPGQAHFRGGGNMYYPYQNAHVSGHAVTPARHVVGGSHIPQLGSHAPPVPLPRLWPGGAKKG